MPFIVYIKIKRNMISNWHNPMPTMAYLRNQGKYDQEMAHLWI